MNHSSFHRPPFLNAELVKAAAGLQHLASSGRVAVGFGAQDKRAEPGRDCGLAVVAAVIMIATMVAAIAISGKAVLIVRVMIAAALMASPIARLVAVEVVERLFAAARHRSSVAVAGIIAIVDMAVEVVVATVPPA